MDALPRSLELCSQYKDRENNLPSTNKVQVSLTHSFCLQEAGQEPKLMEQEAVLRQSLQEDS